MITPQWPLAQGHGLYKKIFSHAAFNALLEATHGGDTAKRILAIVFMN